jgi:hypothetical protein
MGKVFIPHDCPTVPVLWVTPCQCLALRRRDDLFERSRAVGWLPS